MPHPPDLSPPPTAGDLSKRPTLSRSLAKLRALGVTPSCIVDVGAGVDTMALRETFPDLHHHLFEPDAAHLAQLAANYRDVPHTIYPVQVGGRPWGIDYFFAGAAQLPDGLLLKIDVDGPDLEIMRASLRTIAKAAIVVVEAPLHALADRAGFLQAQGLELVDIVDLSYCQEQLWQVDLVFVPWATAHRSPFQTLRTEAIDPSEWLTLGHD